MPSTWRSQVAPRSSAGSTSASNRRRKLVRLHEAAFQRSMPALRPLLRARRPQCRAGPGPSQAGLRRCPTRRYADPALCTMARLGVVSPPMNSANPIRPSLPTTEISADAPFAVTAGSLLLEDNAAGSCCDALWCTVQTEAYFTCNGPPARQIADRKSVYLPIGVVKNHPPWGGQSGGGHMSFPIVGIGASAGGLEAISELLAA